MERTSLALNSLALGQKAQVMALDSKGQERRRMLDLGFVQGSVVEAVHKSPAGDPVAYFIRGAVIALRREDAGKIIVEAI